MNLVYTLVASGGAVKSLTKGRIGGYLVTFGSPKQTDLSGEFFTAATDFDFRDGDITAVYLNHRLPLQTRDGGEIVVRDRIGEGTLRKDRYGVLIDALLYNREQYEAALAEMGWSSGTASHLVDREVVEGKSRITRWPLKLDASITPSPNEPRNVVMSLKAYAALRTLTSSRSQLAVTQRAAELMTGILDRRAQRRRLGMGGVDVTEIEWKCVLVAELGVDSAVVDAMIVRKEQGR